MLDVVIIGGGPSGLTLAILLIQSGLKVRVLEKRLDIGDHSRAIGIHPPALEILDRAGVGPKVLQRGVRIRDGVGISRGKVIASLDFGVLPGPHGFVLSLPQSDTVAVLRARLDRLDPEAFVGDTEFVVFSRLPTDTGIVVRARPNNKAAHTGSYELEARYLVGADGTQSSVRDLLGSKFAGEQYPDHYVMGDYPDSTDFGSTAALFLHHQGIIESFPMPGVRRRWVAWISSTEERALGELVLLRTGYTLDENSRTMLSRFRAAHRRVPQMAMGRTILIGDAAHEVSPIGGQGMALGLLDAAALAPILASTGDKSALLKEFSRQRLSAAQIANRQAHLNMALGRPSPQPLIGFRERSFGALTRFPPTRNAVAKKFTMNWSRK